MSFLTEKKGPLPVWGWGVGVIGAVGVGLLLRRAGGGGSTAAAAPIQDATGTDTTGTIGTTGTGTTSGTSGDDTAALLAGLQDTLANLPDQIALTLGAGAYEPWQVPPGDSTPIHSPAPAGGTEAGVHRALLIGVRGLKSQAAQTEVVPKIPKLKLPAKTAPKVVPHAIKGTAERAKSHTAARRVSVFSSALSNLQTHTTIARSVETSVAHHRTAARGPVPPSVHRVLKRFG